MSNSSAVATWAAIPGYEGLYEVSDQGQVRSVDRKVPHGVGNPHGVGPDGRYRTRKGRVLKPVAQDSGHLAVTLSKLGVHRTAMVHVLVKTTFHGPPPDGRIVCHDNGKHADNRLSNLYFGTYQDNAKDKERHGTNHQLNKACCPRMHRYIGPNLLVKRKNRTLDGSGPSRECRACENTRSRRSYLRRTGRLDETFDFQVVSDKYYAKIMADYVEPSIPAQRAESSSDLIASEIN